MGVPSWREGRGQAETDRGGIDGMLGTVFLHVILGG